MSQNQNQPTEAKGFSKRRSRLICISLGLLFIAPVLLAWAMFFQVDTHVFRKTNKGELLKSQHQLKNLALLDYSQKPVKTEGKWNLLYRVGTCDKQCLHVLNKLLRIRVSLGKDMRRTGAYLLSDKPVSAQIKKQLEAIKGLDTKALLSNSKLKAKVDSLTHGKIYLVDPHDNVILSYQGDQAPKDIYSDLKHLLKVSKIG